MNPTTDTIAAISTPPGKSGVAVIRISGRDAFSISDRIFLSFSKRRADEYPDRTQIYGYITDSGERIDDVMLTRFTAPRSYTGEDTVEISCHGGVLITRRVLEAILRAGAVPATAGEFTKRAFINGKLTLTDAEAIGQLLEAESDEQIRLSGSAARENLNNEIGKIRVKITELLSSVFARIDYPDEDLGDYTDGELISGLAECERELSALISTYRTGRAISYGISAVICGKPNVGKSSLYNLILGEDAAIVTDVAGTTRDVLESRAVLGRVVLKLCDTAGIRSASDADKVERIGIERSGSKIDTAELIIAVFDSSADPTDEDAEIIKRIRKTSAVKLALINKIDLGIDKTPLAECDKEVFDRILYVTAHDAEGVRHRLTEAVEELFTDGTLNPRDTAIVSTARVHASLLRARDFIGFAKGALEAGFAQDAASADIERALGAIAECDGRAVSDEVTADIFSKFCVGK